MTNLIPHPRIAAQRERIGRLRLELAALFAEYTELSFDVLPALRHRYEEHFGAAERRIEKLTLDLHKRRRMVELLALKIDRGQRLDARMVELVMRAVQNEHAEIDARLRRAISVGDRSVDGLAPAPRERAREARELYRALARLLHPDARGGQDPATMSYWVVVQEAWLRHDLDLLRAVHHIVTELGAGAAAEPSLLESEERRLTEAIAAERRRLGALRDVEPFSIREELDEQSWVEERRAVLEAEILRLEHEVGRCNEFLTPIFESVSAGEPPEAASELWADWVDQMYLSGRY